ncbi:MAG: DUF692 domain-containing protein [Gammaproteobacteria bacterium]|nr:DUF692 domain-containing protein [Gammaproteobacteria bacterium]
MTTNNRQFSEYPVQGVGIGLRREMASALEQSAQELFNKERLNFFEVAPENWMGAGGKLKKQFHAFTERYPFVTHGLSLSIGSPAPLDEEFVRNIKTFLDEHSIRFYTEHLSYCSDYGHLYDLMPIPFTGEAVHYVAERIKRVQDILERRIAVENVSYYAAPGQELSEVEFVKAVLDEADCDLLLDINNIFVNSINHQYDAENFLKNMPKERVVYFHVAGHFVEAEDLRVDTHGSDVCHEVWELLDKAYDHFGAVPTLLERDFNIPPLPELMQEADRIRTLQTQRLAVNKSSRHVA